MATKSLNRAAAVPSAPSVSFDPPALVRFARSELAKRADAKTARGMAAYMKTTQPYFGVMNTSRREIMVEIWDRFEPPDAGAWKAGVTALFDAGRNGDEPAENPVLPRRDSKMRPPRWHGEREFFYLSCGYAERGGRLGLHTAAALPLFKTMIVRSGWWDIVDDVAANMVGAAFDAQPGRVGPAMERWIDNPDMWVRRAAIICQLKRKERTDTEMLARFCLKCSHETDFFMRKAIGWALRQHARTDPIWVRGFLLRQKDRLSPLSVREAGRHL